MTEARSPRRRPAFNAGCATLLLLSAAPAAAVMGPIAVGCQITSSSLARHWGTADEIAKELCGRLVGWLEKDQVYGLWSYSTTVKQGVASLSFTVLAAQNSEDTLIALRYERKDSTPGGPWQETWLPGGVGRPGARDAASRLTEAFVARLGDTWRKVLEEKLKLIPVAEARWMQKPSRDDPDLRIITSLPFKGHEYLKSSRFRVVCPSGRSAPVCLVSRARPTPGRYTESGTSRPLETLVVEAREREDDCGDRQKKAPVDRVLGRVIALSPAWLLFDDLEDSVMEGFSK
jgi:hypothetical protein